MMMTTLEKLKARVGIAASDTADDVLLQMVIEAVSARADGECNRRFERAVDTTEEFAGDEARLRVERYPVESVSAFDVKENETDGWVRQTGVKYLIRRGCVIDLGGPLASASAVLRVTYTGGYRMPGTEGTDGTELPRDLEGAVLEQCTYWYQNRHRLGLTSVTAEGGSVQQFASLDLLPSVKAVLKRHERWVN